MVGTPSRRQPERALLDAHGGGIAAVDLGERDRRERVPEVLRRRPAEHLHRGPAVQVAALREREREARLERDEREDDAIGVDAEPHRRLEAAHEERRRLVDVHLRAVPLVVREGEGPVRRARLADERRVARLREGGVRETRRDRAESGVQARDLVAVLVERAALGVAQRAVDEGEGRHRGGDAAVDLDLGDDLVDRELEVVGRRAFLHGVDDGHAVAPGDRGAAARFAADDEGDVEACRSGSRRRRR